MLGSYFTFFPKFSLFSFPSSSLYITFLLTVSFLFIFYYSVLFTLVIYTSPLRSSFRRLMLLDIIIILLFLFILVIVLIRLFLVHYFALLLFLSSNFLTFPSHFSLLHIFVTYFLLLCSS